MSRRSRKALKEKYNQLYDERNEGEISVVPIVKVKLNRRNYRADNKNYTPLDTTNISRNKRKFRRRREV